MRRLSICVLIVLFGRDYTKGADTWKTLDMPGAVQTTPRDIDGNNIVGIYSDNHLKQHCFLYDMITQKWTIIDAPDMPSANPISIIIVVSGDNVMERYYEYTERDFMYNISSQKWTIFYGPGGNRDTIGQSVKIFGTDGNMVVGTYTIITGKKDYRLITINQGFVYNGTNYINLDKPGSIAGSTKPVKVRGNKIIGLYEDIQGSHGFLYDMSMQVWSILDMPEARIGGTEPIAITGNYVVGSYFDNSKHEFQHGFLYNINTGKWITLDNPKITVGAGRTTLIRISGNNILVKDDDVHFSLYNIPNQKWTSIEMSGADETIVSDFDDNSVIGTYSNRKTPSNRGRAFLYNGLTWSNIDIPDSIVDITRPTKIKNNLIIGTYYNKSGQHGFLYDITALKEITDTTKNP